MSTLQAGMVIAGKYRLVAALGCGGMGAVWEAQHLTLEMRVAIKFIGSDIVTTKEARVRFEREAKAAARLRSQHVVQVVDYGVDGEIPYLVMELLQGEDLSQRLARRGRLTLLETVDVVTQVGKALARAGEAQIVHRDLKPGNVFVVQGDDREIVKVLDFGVARMPEPIGEGETTITGTLIGSPRYMSPEQARGRAVDHRSDLWSLAVIAYRALTGEVPFPGDDLADILVKVCSEAPPPPSRLRDDLGDHGPTLDAFFTRALARDPDARFPSAGDFIRAFAVAAGEPPPSTVSAVFTPPAAAAPPSPPPTTERSQGALSPSPPVATRQTCATIPDAPVALRPTADITLPSGSMPPVRLSALPPAPLPGPDIGREPMPSSLRASVDDGRPAAPRPSRGQPLRRVVTGGASVAALACAVLLGWWLGRPPAGAGPAIVTVPSEPAAGELHAAAATVPASSVAQAASAAPVASVQPAASAAPSVPAPSASGEPEAPPPDASPAASTAKAAAAPVPSAPSQVRGMRKTRKPPRNFPALGF